MGVVQNSIDIQKIIASGGDPEIAERVAQLETEIGDENSGIIKDIDDLQEANALIMTSVSAIKTTADSAKARADQAVLWSERKGYVGKNLLKNIATSGKIREVTYTVNSDGSVTANGTATGGNSSLNVYHNASFPAGSYIVTGTPASGSIDTYRLQVYDDTASQAYGDTGNGINISNLEGHDIYIQIVTLNTKSVDATFYPMMRLASIADDTYEPYLESNSELANSKLDTATLKTVASGASDFADFKTAIAAL